jgi:hypothetical protein
MKGAWFIVCAMMCMPSMGNAAGGDYAHLILEKSSDSPFAEIRYEVSERGPASAAIHRRRMPGEIRSLHNMGLIPLEKVRALRATLLENAALSLPDVPKRTHAGGSLTWRFEAQLDGKKHTFLVRDPINQPDRRYWRIFEGLRSLVRSTTGGLPFQDVYYPKKNMGLLTLKSSPIARLSVDGRDTELETPIRALPLLAGKHTIELKSLEGKVVRRYDIRIEAGGHTKLRLDLR